MLCQLNNYLVIKLVQLLSLRGCWAEAGDHPICAQVSQLIQHVLFSQLIQHVLFSQLIKHVLFPSKQLIAVIDAFTEVVLQIKLDAVVDIIVYCWVCLWYSYV